MVGAPKMYCKVHKVYHVCEHTRLRAHATDPTSSATSSTAAASSSAAAASPTGAGLDPAKGATRAGGGVPDVGVPDIEDVPKAAQVPGPPTATISRADLSHLRPISV